MTWDIIILVFCFSCIFLFKSLFLRLVLFIAFYPINIVFAYKYNFPMSGLLTKMGGNYYADHIVNQAFLWQVIGYLILVLILSTVRRKIPEIKIIKLTIASRYILLMMIFVFGAFTYPKVFFLSESRFNLLPGNGWGSIYNALNVLFILSSCKRTLVDRIHLALVLFLIVSGNRADNILILLFLMVYKGDQLKTENFSYLKIALPVGVIFIAGVLIGFLRFNAFETQVILSLIATSIYSQATAMDAVHTYLTSVWYYYSREPNMMVYINTPFTILPATPFGGVASEYNYTQFLSKHILNYGGGMYYAEAAMNFGLMGVVVYHIFYGLFLRHVLKYKSFIHSVLFVLLFLLQLRLQWYGMLYLVKPVIMTVFFVTLVLIGLNKPLLLRMSKS